MRVGKRVVNMVTRCDRLSNSSASFPITVVIREANPSRIASEDAYHLIPRALPNESLSLK